VANDGKLSSLRIKHAGRILEKKGSLDERTDKIIGQLESILKKHSIGEALIEIPSGKVHLRHRGGGSGLAAYGFSTGAIWQFMRGRLGKDRVYSVSERWTGGHSKEKRRRVALKAYPWLDDIIDPEMDVSDAIALVIWWREQHA
jgi:hypothetical protein